MRIILPTSKLSLDCFLHQNCLGCNLGRNHPPRDAFEGKRSKDSCWGLTLGMPAGCFLWVCLLAGTKRASVSLLCLPEPVCYISLLQALSATDCLALFWFHSIARNAEKYRQLWGQSWLQEQCEEKTCRKGFFGLLRIQSAVLALNIALIYSKARNNVLAVVSHSKVRLQIGSTSH